MKANEQGEYRYFIDDEEFVFDREEKIAVMSDSMIAAMKGNREEFKTLLVSNEPLHHHELYRRLCLATDVIADLMFHLHGTLPDLFRTAALKEISSLYDAIIAKRGRKKGRILDDLLRDEWHPMALEAYREKPEQYQILTEEHLEKGVWSIGSKQAKRDFLRNVLKNICEARGADTANMVKVVLAFMSTQSSSK